MIKEGGFHEGYEPGYKKGYSAPKWIPCAERLPIIESPLKDGCSDTGHKFLITDSEGFVYESTFWKIANEFEDDAIAWQPLPEKYCEA